MRRRWMLAGRVSLPCRRAAQVRNRAIAACRTLLNGDARSRDGNGLEQTVRSAGRRIALPDAMLDHRREDRLHMLRNDGVSARETVPRRARRATIRWRHAATGRRSIRRRCACGRPAPARSRAAPAPHGCGARSCCSVAQQLDADDGLERVDEVAPVHPAQQFPFGGRCRISRGARASRSGRAAIRAVGTCQLALAGFAWR